MYIDMTSLYKHEGDIYQVMGVDFVPGAWDIKIVLLGPNGQFAVNLAEWSEYERV